MAGADDHDQGRTAYVRAALGMLKAVALTGEDLLSRAVQDAPIEEGELRGSAALVLVVNGSRFEGEGSAEAARARVRQLARDGQKISLDAEVTFNTVYAARQHEETTWKHPLGGRAKYLESNLVAQSGRYLKIINLSTEKGAD